MTNYHELPRNNLSEVNIRTLVKVMNTMDTQRATVHNLTANLGHHAVFLPTSKAGRSICKHILGIYVALTADRIADPWELATMLGL